MKTSIEEYLEKVKVYDEDCKGKKKSKKFKLKKKKESINEETTVIQDYKNALNTSLIGIQDAKSIMKHNKKIFYSLMNLEKEIQTLIYDINDDINLIPSSDYDPYDNTDDDVDVFPS